MKLTNQQIYQYASNLLEAFNNTKLYIPAKANFFIQKNQSILVAAAQEIEQARFKIAQHYGELTETSGSYTIPEDKLEIANKELQELFAIEQELDIKTFSIDDLGNAEFTAQQMQAILFMISED